MVIWQLISKLRFSILVDSYWIWKEMRSWVSRNDVSCDILIHNFTKNYPSPWSIEFCCSKWAMTRLSATNSSHHSGPKSLQKIACYKILPKKQNIYCMYILHIFFIWGKIYHIRIFEINCTNILSIITLNSNYTISI